MCFKGSITNKKYKNHAKNNGSEADFKSLKQERGAGLAASGYINVF